jgi:hypothetical protein
MPTAVHWNERYCVQSLSHAFTLAADAHHMAGFGPPPTPLSPTAAPWMTPCSSAHCCPPLSSFESTSTTATAGPCVPPKSAIQTCYSANSFKAARHYPYRCRAAANAAARRLHEWQAGGLAVA